MVASALIAKILGSRAALLTKCGFLARFRTSTVRAVLAHGHMRHEVRQTDCTSTLGSLTSRGEPGLHNFKSVLSRVVVGIGVRRLVVQFVRGCMRTGGARLTEHGFDNGWLRARLWALSFATFRRLAFRSFGNTSNGSLWRRRRSRPLRLLRLVRDVRDVPSTSSVSLEPLG